VLKKQFLKDYKGKIQFGVSIYLLDEELAKRPAFQNGGYNQNQNNSAGQRTNNIFIEPKKIGMMIKKTLTETGASVRLVLPEINSLSLASVAVTGNLLLQKGAEVCLIAGKEKVYVGKTLTVQDFEDYGRRDYQRPVRDDKQGMIPPKVAQVMLNLSGCKPGSTILDPFCGIGTIIQEGLLLGYRMFGSDINRVAVRGSEQNLEWFRNRYKIAPGKYILNTSDATKVAELIGKEKISSIVTECTLGPIYGNYPKEHEIKKNFADLTELYSKTFQEFTKFLPSGAKIVMCIPAYKKGRHEYEMPLRKGDVIRIGGMSFRVLWPSGEAANGNDEGNDKSLVLLLESGARTTLYTGDASEKIERTVASGIGPVDILKVGHHGSKYSTGEALLLSTRPRAAIIGVGKNRYGHPAHEVLSRLQAFGIPVFRTDRDGSMRVPFEADMRILAAD
jgi:tRNA G10  N-methylase Trm11